MADDNKAMVNGLELREKTSEEQHAVAIAQREAAAVDVLGRYLAGAPN
jgi:hypothetical protein